MNVYSLPIRERADQYPWMNIEHDIEEWSEGDTLDAIKLRTDVGLSLIHI